MRAVWATFTRELRAYFFSPLAYVVLFFFLIVNGGVFTTVISFLTSPSAPGGPPLTLFFGGTIFFWLILMFVVPVLTMRLFSEEYRSGSIEVLMTAPVTEGQVVAGKYLAVLVFYAFLWLPTLAYAGIIAHFNPVDWGPVAAGYLGILGLGAMFLAAGAFASAMTKNQLVAAIITFALLVFFFLISFLENLVNGDLAKRAIGYVNLLDHMDELAKGIVDTRRLVYYLSVTLFFLFLTSRALEDRKWR
jgi:ABC-2 type transport system permease protein